MVWRIVRDVRTQKAIYLVLLAATYSPLSTQILSPVYGAIPSNVYHKYGIFTSIMLAFTVRGNLPRWAERSIPSLAYWIPSIHFVLFQYSESLGNPLGPVVTEALTIYPLVALSMYLATQLLDEVDLGLSRSSLSEAGPSMFCYVLFTLGQRSMRSVLPLWLGANVVLSRIGLQLLLATTYALTLTDSYFWPALPSIAFTLVANGHTPLVRTTEVLNNTLALYDYTLLERRESITGYLSVLEDRKNKFRVLRCDHSLLGGNWITPPNRMSQNQIAEPIYAVFTMLEAVRLVERSVEKTPPLSASDSETALNIGLGIGTAPSALIRHGVKTTIIELDPVVHYMAGRHFDLPRNHSYWIGDAVAVLHSIKEKQAASYDYIIHDVFTGGAEPIELFTHEFLSDLSQVLKSNGAIAINFAGDLAMPSVHMVYRTITTVFPSCRVFREDEQVGDDGTPAVGNDVDAGEFSNMVFFCTKTTSPIRFRKPVKADYLGSGARKAFLLPQHEVLPEKFERDGDVLQRSNAKGLEKFQIASAIGHWKLMRKVIPDVIWENW